MKKTLSILITASFFLTLTVGCTNKTITTDASSSTEEILTTDSTSVENQPSTVENNQFRVTVPEQVGDVDVVCQNCQAHFKLSQQIQKMSMKGDAIIDCPVCHKDYLGKH